MAYPLRRESGPGEALARLAEVGGFPRRLGRPEGGRMLGVAGADEDRMVTRLGVEPRTPGFKVPSEGNSPEKDGVG